MGATVVMLNRFRPKVISLMDPVTGEMISALAMEPNTSIDSGRVFIVDEWDPGDGKEKKGHFAGRIIQLSWLQDIEKLEKRNRELLDTIDNGTFGPCPLCGAKIVTRIDDDFVCNAVIDDNGKRCQFRTPLQKWTRP